MLKHHYYYPYHSSPSMNSSVVMSSSASAAAAATSWEEKAFAEDHAAGSSPLGCIWPPRSYSCSFCMREFRSAQALGGHMNVHRRDRARLKQCIHHNNTPHHPPAPPDHRHGFAPFSPPPPPPRAFLSSPNYFTAAAAAAASLSTDLSKVAAVMRSSGEEEEDCSNINIRLLGGGEVETDLSVGLIHCRGINRQSHGSSCKRPKIANTSPFPFFLQSAEAASMEEFEADLDLELRLGDPITPKVK